MIIVETANSTYQINDSQTAVRKIHPQETPWNPAGILNLKIGEVFVFVDEGDNFTKTSAVTAIRNG